MVKKSSDHIDTILAQWRLERPDLNVAAIGQLGRLFRVVELADQELTRRLAAHELQPGWFDILAALRRSGSPYELTPTQLMSSTIVTSGGLTKRLDRMAEAGLLSRRPDPTDRRGTRIRLTRKGKNAIDRALPDHIANEESVLSPLSSTDRRHLDALLRQLLSGLESIEDRD